MKHSGGKGHLRREDDLGRIFGRLPRRSSPRSPRSRTAPVSTRLAIWRRARATSTRSSRRSRPVTRPRWTRLVPFSVRREGLWRLRWARPTARCSAGRHHRHCAAFTDRRARRDRRLFGRELQLRRDSPDCFPAAAPGSESRRCWREFREAAATTAPPALSTSLSVVGTSDRFLVWQQPERDRRR